MPSLVRSFERNRIYYNINVQVLKSFSYFLWFIFALFHLFHNVRIVLLLKFRYSYIILC